MNPLLAFGLLACIGAAPTTSPTDFPAAWIGRWTGACQVVQMADQPKVLNLKMEIEIAATDDPKRFGWQIVYVDGDKRQLRPYELIVVDAAKGRYVIDEKSSIKIDACFIEGALFIQFRVQSSLITASYRVEGGEMILEMVSADAARATESGGENGVPKVTSNRITGVERATLRRVEPSAGDR
jgi:hypothetical protein